MSAQSASTTATAPAASPHRTLTGHDGGVRSVVVSPDGSRIVSGGGGGGGGAGSDGTVRLWDLATEVAVGPPLTGHPGPVSAVAVVGMPDGRTLLATGGDDGTVRLWDPMTGVELAAVTSLVRCRTSRLWASQDELSPNSW